MSSKTKDNQARLFDYPSVNEKRSKFRMGYNNSLTANFNKIIPTKHLELMPDDKLTAKSDFFSRWLTLEAPVFGEYNIKFNNFFVPNISLWRGWAQFMGNGDNKSAEYLLTGGENFASKVPYFTTKNLALALGSAFFYGGNNSNSLEKYNAVNEFDVPKNHPNTNFEGYKVVVVPFLRYYLGNIADSDTSYFEQQYNYWVEDWNQRADDFRRDGDGKASIDRHVLFCYCVAKDNSYTNNLIENGLIFDPHASTLGVIDTDVLNKSMSEWCEEIYEKGVAFYYEGFNTENIVYKNDTNPEPKVLLPISLDIMPIGAYMLRVADAGNLLFKWGYGITELNHNATQDFGPVAGWYYNYLSDPDSIQAFGDYGVICGYPFNFFKGDADYPTDTMSTYPVDLTMEDIYLRHLGQWLIKEFCGARSLSDYLGNVLSHNVKRQPSGQFRKVYNGVGYRPNLDNPLGTYASATETIEVGIINDEPISFLRYLAYHKCWTDLMRDPRYELRFIYNDPYKSIFLIPNGDGNFVSGDMLALTLNSETNTRFLLNSPNFDDDSAVVNHDNYFNYKTLLQLLSLRNRRIIQDFFTLLSPQPQYGDEARVFTNVGEDLIYRRDDYTGEWSVNSADGGINADNYGKMELSTAPEDNKLSVVSSISVSALRFASKLQQFLERSNIVGSDYLKQLLTHFGVSPRYVIDTEVVYLGGDKFTPVVEPVQMVSADNAETGQSTGQQSGQMYSSANFAKYSYHAKDHGIILQLCTIQNDFKTTTGLQPQRIEKFDFAFPEFADLGAEAMPLKRVINTDGKRGDRFYPKNTFGYMPRYADFKCRLDEVHGDFRKSLSYWLSVRQFNPSLFQKTLGNGSPFNVPELGEKFLYEDADYNAFTYSDDDFDHCLLDISHYDNVVRSLPMLPIPHIN